MPRTLDDDLNTLKIHDNISGSEIHLFYRLPTTDEQVKYTNGAVTRKGGKVVSTLGEIRMKMGTAIIKGFRDGDFEHTVDGKKTAISSDKNSSNYFPGWKGLLKSKAPDLIELLAVHVFERPAMVEDDDHDDEDLSEETGDLTKN